MCSELNATDICQSVVKLWKSFHLCTGVSGNLSERELSEAFVPLVVGGGGGTFLSVMECRLPGELKVMPETNVFAQVITDTWV